MKSITNYKIPLAKKRIAVELLIILLFSFSNTLSAQQFNNWYFPFNSGITFNTNPPSALNDGMLSPIYGYSCASISDNLGQLRFYSDGVRVWNRNHQLMPNGTGLNGDGSQINSVLILPFPSDDKKYYLFTAQGWYGNSVGGQLGCRYSIVDMSLDSGRGDITLKNVPLINTSFEKITALRGANGSNVWVIFKGAAKIYYSFNVTCSGIDPLPIISNTGLDIGMNPSFGDIKSSSDGKLTVSNFLGNPSGFDLEAV